MSGTHTYALLAVSNSAYCEIRRLLVEAGYAGVINAVGEIDMHGIALVRDRKGHDNLERNDLYDGPDPKIRRRHAL